MLVPIRPLVSRLAPPLSRALSLSLSLFAQLVADYAQHEASPAQDLRPCVVEVLCPMKL